MRAPLESTISESHAGSSPAGADLYSRVWWEKNRRAGARRTAEGGCTHMILDRPSFLGFLRGENALQPRTLFRDQLFNFLHEVCRGHVFRFLFPARAHVYFAGLRLFIAHYE